MIEFESYVFTDIINPNIIKSNPYSGFMVQQLSSDVDIESIEHTLINYKLNENLIDRSDWSHLTNLHCKVDVDKHMFELGQLTNNDIITIAIDSNNHYYLIVNAGGNSLGNYVCNYYQSQGDILEEKLFDQYLDDMKLVSRYAKRNRELIISNICELNNWIVCSKLRFETIHNTIEIGNESIIRHNMVSAFAGQRMLISANNGYLDCVGLGNRIWNYSAPCCLNRPERVYLNIETLDDVTNQTVGSNPFNVVLNGNKLQDIVTDTVRVDDHWKTIFKFN